MKKIFLMSLTAIVVLIFSCKSDTPTTYDCAGVTPTYNADIKAIMDKSCATTGCHNATTKAKSINLTTYSLVKSEAGSSRFLGSIEHLNGYDAMPQGASKLADAEIKLISCWIDNGFPEK